MAKILFGVGVADARNKLGGHVFSRNRNGAYLRMKVSPTQPRSVDQLVVRAGFGGFAKAWGGILDDSKRAGWASLAASNPVPDQFGNPQVLTGMQMFMKANRNLFTISQPELDIAPADQAVDGFTTLSVAGSAGAHTLILTFTPDPTGALDHPVAFATPGLSPGKSFVTAFLRLVNASPLGARPSLRDIGPSWEAKFGPLVIGQKIVVNVFNIRDTNGAASQPSSASCIVAA